MALEEILTGLAGAGIGYLQGRSAKKQRERQAELEAQQLQERERQALYRTILGSENVSAEGKNKLLAMVLPQLNQTRQIEERVSAPINQPPVETRHEMAPVAPPNLPTIENLPDRNKLPYTNMMSPVGLATAPRGGVGQQFVSPAEGFSQTKTVTEPIAIFQDKPAEKKVTDPLILETGKRVMEMYQKGEITEVEVRGFVPTYKEAVRSNDPTKMVLPAKVVKTQTTPLEQSLIDERKQSIIESQAKTRKLLNEAQTATASKPITQTAKAGFLRQMKKDVENNVSIKAYNQAARYIGLINTIVDDINAKVKKGDLAPNRIATDQAVINLWNRVQEPGSVTRIEEFRTTAQGEPFINRLSALIQKIKSGGAGITLESMSEIKRLANIVGSQLTKDANIDVESYRQLTKEALPGIEENSLDSIARRFSDKDYMKIDDSADTPSQNKIATPQGDFGDDDIDKLFNK